jgi:hypothetical protein
MVAVVAELLTVRIMVEAVAREYLDRARTVPVVPIHLADIIMAMVAVVVHVVVATLADIPEAVVPALGQAEVVALWPISTTTQ